MLTLLIFCCLWFLLIFLSCSGLESGGSSLLARLPPPVVIRLSVPENHKLCLQCGGSDSSHVVWTHEGRKVLVTPQRTDEPDGDEQRHYGLRSDGGLCFKQLDDSDSGEYHCNGQMVAELQVLTGDGYEVHGGWTLLLPCSSFFKTKQRWFHRRKRGKWEPILTRFKNGSVKPEREGGRLGFENDALQILNLQPEDAGEYQCNGQVLGRVSVLKGHPEPTSVHSSTRTITSPAVTDSDVKKKKKEKKRSENALFLVAVVGFGLMMLLLAAVCLLLISMKCRRKKNYRYATQTHEDTELQPWTSVNTQTEYAVFEGPSLPEEAIRYASLGRQNWRERPSKTPPNRDHQDIIYSSVITRPAA
ncbi:uncharacterized protein [Channa argus]|uniref:uncharacterized protein isoform X1 n=1 Tax=Channa argus TaxID=215402 RepID=UPI003521728E